MRADGPAQPPAAKRSATSGAKASAGGRRSSNASATKPSSFSRLIVREVKLYLGVDATEARRLLTAIALNGQFKIDPNSESSIGRAAELTGLRRSSAKKLLQAIIIGGRSRHSRVTAKADHQRAEESKYALPKSIAAQLDRVAGDATYARDILRKSGATKKTSSRVAKKSVRAIPSGLPSLGKGHR